MGGFIPNSIKTRVIDSWIYGISRDDIAAQNEIATGTVSNILRQDANGIADIDMLRALSKQLKKDGVKTSHFAAGVRLVKRLERLGVSVEEMDSLVELMDVHCFKTGQTIVELISKLEEATEIAFNLGVSLDRLSELFYKLLDKKNGLKSQIALLKNKQAEEFKKYDCTQRDLDDYRNNRHKLYELNELREKLREKEREIEISKKIQENRTKFIEGTELAMKKLVQREVDKFNREFNNGKPLDIYELGFILSQIHYNPCEYSQIIQRVRDKLSSTDENFEVV